MGFIVKKSKLQSIVQETLQGIKALKADSSNLLMGEFCATYGDLPWDVARLVRAFCFDEVTSERAVMKQFVLHHHEGISALF